MTSLQHQIVLIDWRFDLTRHCLCTPDGGEKVLPPKVLDVLQELVRHYPNVVTHEQLIDSVWQGNHYVGGKAVRNTIWQLRQLLAQHPAMTDAIETVRKGGYRLLIEPQGGNGATTTQLNSEPIPSPTAKLPRRFITLFAVTIALGLISFLWWQSQQQVQTHGAIVSLFNDGQLRRYPRVSPDGQWLLYRANDAEQIPQFFLHALSGSPSEPTQLTFDRNHKGIASWAPDQSAIYYFADNDDGCVLQKWDRQQQRATTLTRCEDSVYREISVTPDGRWLAYLAPLTKDGNRSIHLLDLRNPSAPPQRVACEPTCTATQRDRDVAFSPDGRYLVISRRVNDRAEHLYLIDRHNHDQRQLTSDNEDIRGLAWWPDSQHLVFAHARDANATLSRLNINTGERQAFQVSGAEYPSVAAKTRQIFFQHSERQTSLYRWSFKTPQQTPEPLRRDRFHYRDATFDPAHQQLAYISTQSGHAEIWLADLRGAPPKQLTQMRSILSYPRWSRDGKRIAFLNSPAQGNGNTLHILDVESGAVQQVKSTFLFHRAPSWTPDDQALYSATGDLRFSELFKISPNGAHVQQLGNNQARMAQASDSAGLYYYSSHKDGLWRWVDGTTEHDQWIPCSKNIISAYAWALHGNDLYFISEEDNHDSIMQVSLPSTNCVQKLQLPANTVARNSTLTLDPITQSLIFTSSEQRPSEIVALSY